MPRSRNAVVLSQSLAVYSTLCRRSVSIFKEKGNLVYRRGYCTSSKQSSDSIGVPKQTADNVTSQNISSLLWRTRTMVSTFLKQKHALDSSKNDPLRRLIGKVENVVSVQKYTGLLKPYIRLKSTTADKNETCSAEKLEIERDLKHSESSNTFTHEKDNTLEQTAAEWITSANLQEKKPQQSDKGKSSESVSKSIISKASLQSRGRFLVRSLSSATSSSSQVLRLEEVCKHLLQHPQEKSTLAKEGLVRVALRLKQKSSNTDIQAQARVALSLIGYHDPPGGQGIRILSIDGGGTRGLMAIEILRQLQARTGRSVHEMFDYICGVSSGAILTFLLGALRLSPDDCETLYKELSAEVFNQSAIWGAGRLMWYHAYYDTSMWVKTLRKTFGDKMVTDSIRDRSGPKLAAISAVMNLPALRAYVFRNYDYPVRVQSQFMGGTDYKMWEAIRASGAAPGYFEEFHLHGLLHQDGGIMINNPTALAIHEARLLWPSDYIQCVFSLGSGRFIPATTSNSFTSTTLKTKVQKVIDSATDTEAVHISMNDLLSPGTYFRFNPYLTEFLHLDENRPEKLNQLKMDAQMYLRRNEHKLEQSVKVLTRSRSPFKKINDWLQLQKTMLL